MFIHWFQLDAAYVFRIKDLPYISPQRLAFTTSISVSSENQWRVNQV